MINEDYVSFEVAKLLKEKGFNEKCVAYYPQYITPIKLTFGGRVNYNASNKFKMSPPISAPTHQMAMKWLREVHNIFIDIYLPSHSEHEDTIYHGTYSFDIFNLNTKGYIYCTWGEIEFNSYKEAVEAALKYVLENLI